MFANSRYVPSIIPILRICSTHQQKPPVLHWCLTCMIRSKSGWIFGFVDSATQFFTTFLENVSFRQCNDMQWSLASVTMSQNQISWGLSSEKIQSRCLSKDWFNKVGLSTCLFQVLLLLCHMVFASYLFMLYMVILILIFLSYVFWWQLFEMCCECWTT